MDPDEQFAHMQRKTKRAFFARLVAHIEQIGHSGSDL